MNIPAVVLSEVHQTPVNEDEPTRPNSQLAQLWCDAAKVLAAKLLSSSQIKQRCLEMLDVKGAQEAYRYSKELQQLAFVLGNLDTFHPEMAATMRRQTVDRVVAIYEDAGRLLVEL